MEVKAGYKKTEIGIIPEDWEVKKLGKVFNLKQGIQCGIEKQKQELKDGLVRFIRIIDLTSISELPRYIDDPGSSHHIKKNDLFMVRYGNPGLLGYGYDGVIANNLFSMKPLSKQNRQYFYFLLSYLNQNILELSSSTTMAALNFTSLEELILFFPPLPEQKAIAEVLSDTDELIQTLQKQIAKKRLIKQGAMQKLLTPKEGWEVKKLGEIFNISTGIYKKSNRFGSYTIMDMGSVSTNGKIIFSKKIDSALDILEIGDLIMPKDDIGGGNIIGKVAFIDANNRYVLGDHVFKLKSNSLIYNSLYFHYFINNDYFNNLIRKKVTGSAQLGIGKSTVSNCNLTFPRIDEQTRIATILSDMDNEIETLENKLAKYKKLKQGMMQELLTGKTRLV